MEDKMTINMGQALFNQDYRYCHKKFSISKGFYDSSKSPYPPFCKGTKTLFTIEAKIVSNIPIDSWIFIHNPGR